MPDQPHCRWCGMQAERDRNLTSGDWYCHFCFRYQDWMDCPCCGNEVKVKRVEAYLGHPVGKVQEVIDG